MRRILRFALVAFSLLGASEAASAQASLWNLLFNSKPTATQRPPNFDKRAVEAKQPELVVGDKTNSLVGWIKFCEDYGCDKKKTEPQMVVMDAQTWQILAKVNTAVNQEIKQKTDLEHWGTRNERYVYRYNGAVEVDKWDYAEDGYGDCEDFVLVKRRKLIEMGWPRSALLITRVLHYPAMNGKKSPALEGHAVLMVITDAGEFVLDIYNDELRRWWQTEYQFMKRQSQDDQHAWVTLSKPTLASK